MLTNVPHTIANAYPTGELNIPENNIILDKQK
jgi:hypothetical protein